jgi:hypothetical protein
MPSTLRTGLERLVSRLRDGLAVLTTALGPLDADGGRVIEGEARHP